MPISGDLFSDLTRGLRRLSEIKKDLSELEFREVILEQKSLLLDLKGRASETPNRKCGKIRTNKRVAVRAAEGSEPN
jgi:hypothetical protein